MTTEFLCYNSSLTTFISSQVLLLLLLLQELLLLPLSLQLSERGTSQPLAVASRGFAG